MLSHRLLPGRFSEDCCRRQLALMRAATAMNAGGTMASNSVRREIRRSKVGWPDWGFDIVRQAAEAARQVNQELWNFRLHDGMKGGEYQLTQYAAGDEGVYHTHVDMSFDDGPAANRKLSFVLQLSDGGDYCGADLTLHHVPEPDSDQLRRIGSLIVFPSFVPHSVGPLIRGERWSLVGWISGPRFR